MISDQIYESVDLRLSEVQRTLAHIRRLEASSADIRDPISAENAAILRGLFFVHLYGALEYSISLSLQVLLQEMTKAAVPFYQFEHMLHAVALDDNFRSLADPGLRSRWAKRRELLSRQVSNTPCLFNDTVFHDSLQNIWFETLRSVFEYLCIAESPVPEDRMRGYLDEIVDNRNQVAHGRQSAQGVGRRFTSGELQDRLDAVKRVVDHVLGIFDEYLGSRRFIDSQHREPFRASPSAT